MESPFQNRRVLGVDVLDSPRRHGCYVSPRKSPASRSPVVRDVVSDQALQPAELDDFEASVGTYMKRMSLLAAQSQRGFDIDDCEVEDNQLQSQPPPPQKEQQNQNGFELYSYLAAEIGAVTHQISSARDKADRSYAFSKHDDLGKQEDLCRQREYEMLASTRSQMSRQKNHHYSTSFPSAVSTIISFAATQSIPDLDIHQIRNDTERIYETNTCKKDVSSVSSVTSGASDTIIQENNGMLSCSYSTPQLSPIRVLRGKPKIALSDIFEIDNSIKSKKWGAHSMHIIGSHSRSSSEDGRSLRGESLAMPKGLIDGSCQKKPATVDDIGNIESSKVHNIEDAEYRNIDCDSSVRSSPRRVPSGPHAVARTAADIYDLENAITSKVGGKSRSYYGKFHSEEGNQAISSSPENLNGSPGGSIGTSFSEHVRITPRSSVKPRLAIQKRSDNVDRHNLRLPPLMEARRNTVSMLKTQHKMGSQDELDLFVSSRNNLSSRLSTRSLHTSPVRQGEHSLNLEASIDALLKGTAHHLSFRSNSPVKTPRSAKLEASIDALLLGNTRQVSFTGCSPSSSITVKASNCVEKQDLLKLELPRIPFMETREESYSTCAVSAFQTDGSHDITNASKYVDSLFVEERAFYRCADIADEQTSVPCGPECRELSFSSDSAPWKIPTWNIPSNGSESNPYQRTLERSIDALLANYTPNRAIPENKVKIQKLSSEISLDGLLSGVSTNGNHNFDSEPPIPSQNFSKEVRLLTTIESFRAEDESCCGPESDENQQNVTTLENEREKDTTEEELTRLRKTYRRSARDIFKRAVVRLHFNSLGRVDNNQKIDAFFGKEEVPFNQELQTRQKRRRRGFFRRLFRKLKRQKVHE